MILAIDTSGDIAGLALLRPGAEPIELEIPSEEGHAQILFPRLEAFLKSAGVRLEQIECFAAASGPGSFTGVRIALSAAKGLAEAMNKPVAAVSNLKALAWYGTAALRAPVIDARRGEVFAALYNAELELMQPEVACKFQPWFEAIPGNAELICSSGFLPEPATLAPRSLARAIAYIAQRTGGVDPAGIDANYVRRNDAALNWTDLSLAVTRPI